MFGICVEVFSPLHGKTPCFVECLAPRDWCLPWFPRRTRWHQNGRGSGRTCRSDDGPTGAVERLVDGWWWPLTDPKWFGFFMDFFLLSFNEVSFHFCHLIWRVNFGHLKGRNFEGPNTRPFPDRNEWRIWRMESWFSWLEGRHNMNRPTKWIGRF